MRAQRNQVTADRSAIEKIKIVKVVSFAKNDIVATRDFMKKLNS